MIPNKIISLPVFPGNFLASCTMLSCSHLHRHTYDPWVRCCTQNTFLIKRSPITSDYFIQRHYFYRYATRIARLEKYRKRRSVLHVSSCTRGKSAVGTHRTNVTNTSTQCLSCYLYRRLDSCQLYLTYHSWSWWTHTADRTVFSVQWDRILCHNV